MFRVKQKKKGFLLLEVLLGLAFAALCLVPLIRGPIEAYWAEGKLFERVEKERLSDWAFSEVKERLLAHELSWDALPGPGEIKGPFPLSSQWIQYPNRKKKELSVAYFLQCDKLKEKKGEHGELYRLLKVKIVFDGKTPKEETYRYKLLVKRD